MTACEHVKQVAIGVGFLVALELVAGLRVAAHHLDRLMGRPRELTLEQFAAHIGWTVNEFEDWLDEGSHGAFLGLLDIESWGECGPAWVIRDARGLRLVTELQPGQVAYRVG